MLSRWRTDSIFPRQWLVIAFPQKIDRPFVDLFSRCLTEFFNAWKTFVPFPAVFPPLPHPGSRGNDSIVEAHDKISSKRYNYHKKKIVGENYFYKKFNPLSKIYSPPFFFFFFSLSPRLSHLFFKFEYPVSLQSMSTLSTSTRMQTSDLTNRLGAEIEQVPRHSRSAPIRLEPFEYAAFFPDQWNRRDYLGLCRLTSAIIPV